MFYTYILQSIPNPSKLYTGSTANLRSRLHDHNNGKSPYTKKLKPWRLLFYAAFPDKSAALSFERYLKTGSGRALLAKHLIPPSHSKQIVAD